MPVNEVRPALLRPIALWGAAVIVWTACVPVVAWTSYRVVQAELDLPGLSITLLMLLTAVGVAGCQWVAVSRREWGISWMAAGVVGIAFAAPGAMSCAFLPLSILGILYNPPPNAAVVDYVLFALMALWSAAFLAAGIVMLRWARRLYRWHVETALAR
jgi:hypothetical protein